MKPSLIQRKALEHLAAGKTLRGFFYARTYHALKRRGWVEDFDTITDAGRKVIRSNK